MEDVVKNGFDRLAGIRVVLSAFPYMLGGAWN